MDSAIANTILPPAYQGWWRFLLEDLGFDRMPPFVLERFYKSCLNYKDRVFIATHFYKNGVSSFIMSAVIREINPFVTNADIVEMKSLYKY